MSSNDNDSGDSDLQSAVEKKGASLIDALQMFHAGVFIEKCDRQLTSTVLACNDLERDGELTITIKIKPTGKKGGASDQIEISHTLKCVTPTQRGKRSEEDTTVTPAHVGYGGKILEYPERQPGLPGMDTRERARDR